MFFRATPVDKDAAIAAYFSGLRPEPQFLRGEPLRTPNRAAAIADLEAYQLYGYSLSPKPSRAAASGW